MELMRKLNIKEEELRKIPQRKIGSAAVDEGLTIVGETAHPVTLSLGKNAKKFSLHVVFLRELDHLLNLGKLTFGTIFDDFFKFTASPTAEIINVTLSCSRFPLSQGYWCRVGLPAGPTEFLQLCSALAG